MGVQQSIPFIAVLTIAVLASCSGRDAPVERNKPLHTIVFGGDTQLGRRMNRCVDQYGLSRPLARIRDPFVRADLAIVNLECIVSARGFISDPETGKMYHGGIYHFRGRPELVRILVDAGIDVAVLANNHAFDYGPDALMDGIRILGDAGIDAVGAGENLDRAMAPVFRRIGDAVVAVVALHVTNNAIGATKERAGNHFFSIARTKQLVSRVKAQTNLARKRADLVLLAIHWGVNGVLAPTGEMREAARRLIREAGVDAILGSHGHVLHGVEIIDGRPVIYDTGNLLLDFKGKGFMEGDWSRSAVFELRFDKGGVRRLEATPLRVDYCTSYPAESAVRDEILASFVKRSKALGTAVALKGGRAVIELSPAKNRPAPTERYENPAAVTPKLPAPDATASSNVVSSMPSDVKEVGAIFENGRELVGYKAYEEIVAPSPVWLVLYWRTDRPLSEAYDASIRLRDVGAKSVVGWGGGAREMGDWLSPTTQWKPGQIIADEFVLRPPAGAKVGKYNFLVDLKAKNKPVGLTSPGSAAADGSSLVIGEIEVREAKAAE